MLPGRLLRRERRNHDAFRTTALGCVSWFIIRRLYVSDAVSVAELVALGLNRNRAYRALGDLQAAQIARRTPDGWVRVDDDELRERLGASALSAGTWGALWRQADAYLLDRIDDRVRVSPLAPLSGPEPTQLLRHEALDIATAVLLEPARVEVAT